MRAMLRSTFHLAFLVLTLLFAQQGAMSHGISHTLAQQSQDQSLPHETQCELCAAYAHIGSAVSSSDVHFDLGAPTNAVDAAKSTDHHTTTLAAFAARAPPYSA